MKRLILIIGTSMLGACSVLGSSRDAHDVAFYIANDDAREAMLVACSAEPERRWQDENCQYAQAAQTEVQLTRSRMQREQRSEVGYGSADSTE